MAQPTLVAYADVWILSSKAVNDVGGVKNSSIENVV